MSEWIIAQVEPAFPWSIFITVIGGGLVTICGAIVTGAFLHLREMKKIRLESQVEREKVANALAAAGISAQVEKGKQTVESQKQTDTHDLAWLEKFMGRIDKLEKNIEDERSRCVEEIKEVRAQHADCMDKHAQAMWKLGQVESTTTANKVEIRAVREESVSINQKMAVVESKVIALATAAEPVVETMVETMHVEAKTAIIKTGETK